MPGVLRNLIAIHFDSLNCESGVERDLFTNERLCHICERLSAYNADNDIRSTWTSLQEIINRFVDEFSPCWEDLSFIGNETQISLVSQFQKTFVDTFNLTHRQAQEVAEFLYRNNLLSVPE
jgi:hypothetical protein